MGLLLAIALAAPAQPISFDRIGPAQGLSQSTIRAVYQDRQGFLWIATRDGLNRYDGQTFQIFRHRHGEPTSLQSSDIATIREDKQGRLWVGTFTGGLHRLNPDGHTFTRILKTSDGVDVSQWAISCLAEDDRGRIWAGTLGNGWLVVDSQRGRVEHYRLPTRKNGSLYVTAALTDTNGTVWFGLDNGTLLHLTKRGNQFIFSKITKNPFASGSARITALLRDRAGNLLVATRSRGLYQFNEQTTMFKPLWREVDTGQQENLITSLTEDHTGNLWVGTDDGIRLLRSTNPNDLRILRPDPADESSLSTHAVHSLMTDRRGNVWAGTWEGGLNVWYADPPRLEVISTRLTGPRRLTFPKVSAVAADGEGGVWVGSNRGLTHFLPDGRTTQPVAAPPSFNSHDVYRMFADRLGNVYASFWHGGVVRYRADGRASIVPLALPGVRYVQSFAQEASGKVWMIRSDNQLLLYDARTERADTSGNVHALLRIPTSITITCLLEAHDGWLWFGTYNNGLFGWNRQTGRRIHYAATGKPGSLSDSHVTCLHEDATGTLWIGTDGAGLNGRKRSANTFTLYTKRQGLSGDMIAGLEEDRRGNLWISTTEGLTRLRLSSRQLTVYDESDGLPTSEFVNPGSTRLPTGDLAFATTRGLVLLHPDRFDKPLPPTKAYLTELRLFNRPVAIGTPDSPLARALSETQELTLTPQQTVFTLGFGALCWGRNRHVVYAYRLDDFDRDWNYTDQQRNTTYTNLPPGTYVFRLKAAQGDHRWGPEKRLVITVQPPWFKTGWAIGLYLLLLTGILTLIRHIIRVREKLKADIRIQALKAENVRQLDEAKTSFFTNISHEFRTPLTLILTPLEKLLTDELPPEARLQHQFRVMHRNANRLLRLINQLLDLSKIESGSLQPQLGLGDLAHHLETIGHSFDELADSRQISLQIHIDPILNSVWFDADFVEKITNNLLSNALRYTPDQEQVIVDAQCRDNRLHLTVTDSGPGIFADDLPRIFERFYRGKGSKLSGTGVGLALTRELVDLLRGTIRVNSQPGAGSRFTVELPLQATAFPAEWLTVSKSYPSPEAREQPRPPSEPSTINHEQRVLIAEDDPDLRAYLIESFADNFRVIEASDGRQALDLARKYMPDLIITDWIMPELEGPDLCRLLKTDEKTSHIPIILLTSKSSQESELAGLNVGADDYITKPFSAVLLQSRAQNLLESRRRLRQAFSQEVWLRPTDVQLTNLDEVFLQRATAFIEEHIDDPNFDAEQLQEVMSMSQMQLYRKLKSLTELSARDFIRYIRLQRAAQLLESGQVTVAEAGYQVGFNDRSYFSRAFKKQFGQSPQDYIASKQPG